MKKKKSLGLTKSTITFLTDKQAKHIYGGGRTGEAPQAASCHNHSCRSTHAHSAHSCNDHSCTCG